MNKMSNYGGWALITGASSGIGREFACQIAAKGVNCVLVARRGERLKTLAEELKKDHGIECRCIEQDLTADGAVEKIGNFVDDISIGILVNNAGFGYPGNFETRDPKCMETMIRLNCTIPVLMTSQFLPGMLERGRGAVIMVASVVGFVPAPYDSVYSATKAFDLFYGQSLWGELKGTGVDVITLCPGVTKTEFFEVEGMSKEQEAQVLKSGDEPKDIVALTLRNLGRKPVAAPWSSLYPSLLARILPRKIVIKIMLHFMKDRADRVN